MHKFTPCRGFEVYTKNLSTGLCAAALSRDGIIVLDITASQAKDFIDQLRKDLSEMESDFGDTFDASGSYGYVWIFFDAKKWSSKSAGEHVRQQYNPIME